MLRTEGTYYARSQHGGHRVVADSQGFLVDWPSGTKRYGSARQTIIALSNSAPAPLPHHRDPKVTFNRYFRTGKYSRPSPRIDTLTLFSPDLTIEEPKVKINSSPAISIASPKLGVDLAKRGHEVRKLFYAGYGKRVVRYGYDPEDVLQEIYKGILVRNNGKCPFDAEKSSFGHYVHMVCGCLVSNYHRRYSRLVRNEQFGVLAMKDSKLEMVDVRDSDLAIENPTHQDVVATMSIQDSLTRLVEIRARSCGYSSTLAAQCLGFMIEGYRRGEIAALTEEPPNLISKVLKMIRRVASEWRTHVDI